MDTLIKIEIDGKKFEIEGLLLKGRQTPIWNQKIDI
jgi:hypothetical protein